MMPEVRRSRDFQPVPCGGFPGPFLNEGVPWLLLLRRLPGRVPTCWLPRRWLAGYEYRVGPCGAGWQRASCPRPCASAAGTCAGGRRTSASLSTLYARTAADGGLPGRDWQISPDCGRLLFPPGNGCARFSPVPAAVTSVVGRHRGSPAGTLFFSGRTGETPVPPDILKHTLNQRS